MSALATKLRRDLGRMVGQGLTIALVVACGIASYVTLQSAYASLLAARDDYYASCRFADVFAHVKRAPESLAARIADIPGVALAETRLVEPVMLPVEGLSEPATGRLVSLPRSGEPRLNALVLREGRALDASRPDEVLVLESFAEAHHLEPGARLPVVMNGVLRSLQVVGVVLSPEYVMAVGGGAGQEFAPDALHFAVLFMGRDAMAPAFDLAGAFDDVTLRLEPGASERDVRAQLDALVAPYGGVGSVGRSRQPSAFFVDNELSQLDSYATVAPMLFLGVAAFLVNVVLSRLVHLQRPQIATLKALGYGRARIGAHFLELVGAIAALGCVAGVALGAWLGRGTLGMYAPYFRFPSLAYRLDARIAAAGVLVSLASAALGALGVVARVVRLPPAEAMQPEAPPTYEPSLLERLGVARLLSTEGRMVLRELTRRPLRFFFSVAGIACGVGVVVVGGFTFDAFDVILDLEFESAERHDVAVSFTRPVPASSLRTLAAMPGVLAVEPLRVVPVRLRSGHRFHETALVGHPAGAELRRVVEWPWHVAPVPDDGLMLTDMLADKLGLTIGDSVTLEVLEGDRRTRTAQVTALSREVFGMMAHMELGALHRLVGEEPVVSTALLRTDPADEAGVDARLKRLPAVASVGKRRQVIAQFERQTAETMRITALVLTLFGCAIALAIVYNNARIALSVRGRDLATLRVLGFTRGEISAVLLGELATHVLVAVPPGLLVGRALSGFMMANVDAELYRMPVIISGATYAFGACVTLLAAMGSALLVRGKLGELDLVGALKARE